MYFLHVWIVLTQRWQRGNAGNAATLATQSSFCSYTMKNLRPAQRAKIPCLGNNCHY